MLSMLGLLVLGGAFVGLLSGLLGVGGGCLFFTLLVAGHRGGGG